MIMDKPVIIPNIYGFTCEDSQYLWIHQRGFPLFIDSPVMIPYMVGFTCDYSQYLLIHL